MSGYDGRREEPPYDTLHPPMTESETRAATIEKIKSAVEEIAARNQDEWAFGAGHPEQKWETVSERVKQNWRDRVTVREIIQELEEPT